MVKSLPETCRGHYAILWYLSLLKNSSPVKWFLQKIFLLSFFLMLRSEWWIQTLSYLNDMLCNAWFYLYWWLVPIKKTKPFGNFLCIEVTSKQKMKCFFISSLNGNTWSWLERNIGISSLKKHQDIMCIFFFFFFFLSRLSMVESAKPLSWWP